MNLDILLGQNRFIVGSGRLDAPLIMPPLFFGDTMPVQLRAWELGANGIPSAVSLDDYDITLLVGPPNTRPSLGFWQVTTTAGVSSAIPARADAQTVRDALSHAFGEVTVDGGNGSYVVTLVQAGVWALPSATFQGNTLSGVLIFQVTAGTTETPAQYRMEVLEIAPGRIIPASWSDGDTTVANSFTQISGSLWMLTLDSRIDSGFFSLTVDGVTTQFLMNDVAGYQIAMALSAIGKPATIQPNGSGGFFVSFIGSVTAASVNSHLVILPYMVSALALTSSGVRELLDGLQFAPVNMSILLTKDGKTFTAASTDMVLQMPVNQPALIVIDAPEMAGLTFSISDDQSYMQVYQNGILISSIILNTPVT